MKSLLRAASIGFGSTLGVGAAIILGGGLVALLTRSAVLRTVDAGLDQLRDYIDQAADRISTDQDREQDHVHTPTCPCPDVIKLCGQTFPAGQGPCKLLAGHTGSHSSVAPVFDEV